MCRVVLASRRGFQQEHDATIAASEDLNLPRHSGASSSSQHTAASTLPRHLKQGSRGTGSRRLVADYDSVASRMDRETVVSSLFESVSEEKRDRDQKVVDRQNLHKILDQKAELVRGGENLAQHRFFEAEADVEVKHWEKRNSDIALYEINQEFEVPTITATTGESMTDHAQRNKMSLYGELELRNRLFQEDQARDCQEIEELRRICCEETDQTRQARIEELSMQQQRHPMTVSQMMA